jgi:hypothetical protein
MAIGHALRRLLPRRRRARSAYVLGIVRDDRSGNPLRSQRPRLEKGGAAMSANIYANKKSPARERLILTFPEHARKRLLLQFLVLAAQETPASWRRGDLIDLACSYGKFFRTLRSDFESIIDRPLREILEELKPTK